MEPMESKMPDTLPTAPRKNIIWLIAGLVGAVFLAGLAAGFLTQAAKSGGAIVEPAIGATFVGLTAAALSIWFYRPHFSRWSSMSPRRRLYWSSLIGSGVVGGVVGVLLQIDQNKGGDVSLLSNGPLTPQFAFIAAALWVIGIGVACIAYHRALDDHEERAWLWAGLAGWYAFVIPAPVWWVLHRAALTPPVDVMVLFILSMIVNAIVWSWLKFR